MATQMQSVHEGVQSSPVRIPEPESFRDLAGLLLAQAVEWRRAPEGSVLRLEERLVAGLAAWREDPRPEVKLALAGIRAELRRHGTPEQSKRLGDADRERPGLAPLEVAQG